ncbi:MAG: ATP-binding protein [Phototrophicaceae bacterium]
MVILIIMAVFNTFSILVQVLPIMIIDGTIINSAFIGWELSLGWVSIAYFLMLAGWIRLGNRRFAIVGISTGIIFSLLILLTRWATDSPSGSSDVIYTFMPSTIIVVLGFDLAIINWVIRFRNRFDSNLLYWATFLFVLGHLLNLNHPIEQVKSGAVIAISTSGLLICYSVIKRDVITPWKDQRSQLNAIHRTSLAVAQQLNIDYVTQQVVNQVKDWLNCDGVSVSLLQDNQLTIVAVAGLPIGYVGHVLDSKIYKEAITSLSPIKLDDAGNTLDSLPFAKETFGAVLCTPLVYGDDAIGMLLVVNRKHGMIFTDEQKHLLELFSAQASVSIIHSQTFHHQQHLVEEIKSARIQLETVLANTPNPVIAVNKQLQVIFSNNASKVYFPKLDNHLIPISSVIPSYLLPQGSPSPKSYRLLTYEGTYNKQDFVIRIAPIRPNRRIGGWVAVAVDVTRLKELDRIKSEMIRMTSHDLKNPLQSAFANLDLLYDEMPADRPDLQGYLNQLDRELGRIDRIISGILDLERAQSEMNTDQSVVIQETLAMALSEIEAVAHKKQIHFQVEMPIVPIIVQGHSVHLQRAIANLLENAVKFSVPPAIIEILCYPNRQNVIIEIKDYGVGIPTVDQPKVFDRFFRSSSPASAHITGTGLGLSLVKTVIDRHGGQIWLESEIGKGTSFYISLLMDTKSMIDLDD